MFSIGIVLRSDKSQVNSINFKYQRSKVLLNELPYKRSKADLFIVLYTYIACFHSIVFIVILVNNSTRTFDLFVIIFLKVRHGGHMWRWVLQMQSLV